MTGDAERIALDTEIALAWPADWLKANDPTKRGRSKARNNLRKRYRHVTELAAFKAANPNARCGNCDHCSVPGMMKDMVCELDSDFHGYQITTADNVCARWDAPK